MTRPSRVRQRRGGHRRGGIGQSRPAGARPARTSPPARSPRRGWWPGRPEHTLNALGVTIGTGAPPARPCWRPATSVTCTKSRVWPPSSNTSGASPAAERLAPQGGDAGVGGVGRQAGGRRRCGSAGPPQTPASRGPMPRTGAPGPPWPRRTPSGGRGGPIPRPATTMSLRRAHGADGVPAARVQITCPAGPGPDHIRARRRRSGLRRRRPSSWPTPAGRRNRPPAMAASRLAVASSLSET